VNVALEQQLRRARRRDRRQGLLLTGGGPHLLGNPITYAAPATRFPAVPIRMGEFFDSSVLPFCVPRSAP